MVYCCVPRCNAGRKNDPSISFHAFPSNPDMAAKWIRNINLFIPNGGTWFPQTGNVVCSKHFLQSDFKPEMKTPNLKPRSVPTVFEKAVSHNPTMVATSGVKRKKVEPKSPLIVKVIKPVQDCEDTEMDDTPLTKLLQEDMLTSPSFSAPSSSVSSSVMSSSSSHFCITQVTSLANSPTFRLRIDNSCIPDSSSIPVTETEGDVSHEPSNVSALEEDVPCVENRSVNKISKEVNKPSKPKNPVSLKKSRNTLICPKIKESNDLIEIGPSTFLKINPEVIKVTKKVTPSGNTVLQFVMNPSLGLDAKSIFEPVTKKDALSARGKTNQTVNSSNIHDPDDNTNVEKVSDLSNDADSQCSSMSKNGSMLPDTTSPNIVELVESNNARVAPVVLSTNLPVSQSFGLSMQQRHANVMRQKNRQIQVLKAKVDKLLKKVDELETKCIVQERQLDFPSLKKLRAIKKNADKGEPHANFILEQIRGYFGNNPLRWSDSTMTQCSVWCRKAPYAYEYFKKANLFRLPCLGTVKRYMKKHPEITTQIKNRTLGVHALDSDDSSSDFDFDEDDDLPNDEDSMNGTSQIECETVLSMPSSFQSETSQGGIVPNETSKTEEENHTSVTAPNFVFSSTQPVDSTQSSSKTDHAVSSEDSNNASQHEEKQGEETSQMVKLERESEPCSASIDVAKNDQLPKDAVKTTSADEVKSIYLPTNEEGHITAMNLNGQEIILQPGNIIQLNSNLDDGEGVENQYFVIPAPDDQSASGDHQYSVAQPLSFVIQNGENEEQVIYITEDATETAETVAVSLTD